MVRLTEVFIVREGKNELIKILRDPGVVHKGASPTPLVNKAMKAMTGTKPEDFQLTSKEYNLLATSVQSGDLHKAIEILGVNTSGPHTTATHNPVTGKPWGTPEKKTAGSKPDLSDKHWDDLSDLAEKVHGEMMDAGSGWAEFAFFDQSAAKRFVAGLPSSQVGRNLGIQASGLHIEKFNLGDPDPDDPGSNADNWAVTASWG